MAKVYIDNVEYEVPDGKNLLEVCLSLGKDITYFLLAPEDAFRRCLSSVRRNRLSR